MEITWRKLNAELRTLDETKVLEMLTEERSDAKRVAVLERLHQRYTTSAPYLILQWRNLNDTHKPMESATQSRAIYFEDTPKRL